MTVLLTEAVLQLESASVTVPESAPVPQSASRQQWTVVTVNQLELPRKFKGAQ